MRSAIPCAFNQKSGLTICPKWDTSQTKAQRIMAIPSRIVIPSVAIADSALRGRDPSLMQQHHQPMKPLQFDPHRPYQFFINESARIALKINTHTVQSSA
jgi:hypothetical protein